MAGPPEEPPRPEPRRSRFPRAHRLKRQRLIRPLFASERTDVHALRVGPLAIRYRLASPADVGQEVPLQVAFAVSRRIGSKPARNRIRRVMREVYRVRQHDLIDLFSHRPEVLTLVVLYRGRREGAEAAVRRALPEALRRVARAFTE